MSTPLYDRLLERAQQYYRETLDRDMPAGRLDTREQYSAAHAAESVVEPLSDRDVIDVIIEVFARVGRNKYYPVDGYPNLAEALRGTLELALYRDVLPEGSD